MSDAYRTSGTPEFWPQGSSSNPYAYYSQLRERGRVVGVASGYWMVTTFPECSTVLRSRLFGHAGVSQITQQRAKEHLRSSVTRRLISLDPPDHTRLRTLIGRAVTNSFLETLRPKIAATAGSLVERTGMFDAVSEFAQPLVTRTIGALLGIPEEKYWLLEGGAKLFRAVYQDDSEVPGNTGSEEASKILYSYFRHLASHEFLEDNPLIVELQNARYIKDSLSNDEIAGACMMLLTAGHQTTTNLVGSSLYALACHPQVYAALLEEPELLSRASDELARYESPVQMLARRALQSVRLGDTILSQGDLALVLIGSANRDPATFESPDILNFSRQREQHLAFGAGLHFCIGANLARIVLEEVLRALSVMASQITLSSNGVKWISSQWIRGPSELWIQLVPH